MHSSKFPVHLATIEPGTAWRSQSGSKAHLHVVLKGRCRFESSQGVVEVAESYAALVPQGQEYRACTGVAGAMLGLLELDLGPIVTATRSHATGIEQLEDSHSYFLVSRLLAAAFSGYGSNVCRDLVREIGSHLGSAAHRAPFERRTAVDATVDVLHWQTLAPPSMDELGDRANLHPMTLARKFRKRWGCSIGEFRQRIRVERAFYRLIKTPTPLAQIGLMCGFADQSHMTRHFRRFFGTTPALLRRITDRRYPAAFSG